MEEKLRKLTTNPLEVEEYKTNYLGHLFADTALYVVDQIEATPCEDLEEIAPLVEEAPVVKTEKAHAIESLKKYVAENDKAIDFEGGSITLSEPVYEKKSIRLEKSIELSDKRDILFFGDSLDNGNQILRKMIGGMKLEESEYNVLDFDEVAFHSDEASYFEKVFSAIISYQSKYVISFGANATNLLLGKKERLTKIHGKFIQRVLDYSSGTHECIIVPVFHPNYLAINPNMKRSAWTDLQKVLESKTQA